MSIKAITYNYNEQISWSIVITGILMKILLLLSFAVFSFSPSSAQHRLFGTITNQQGAPIPFVSIYIQNTTYGSTANENGDYLFKLNPGTYNVIYRFVGYKEKSWRHRREAQRAVGKR